jgi:iron complex outermembrane receptor protein
MRHFRSGQQKRIGEALLKNINTRPGVSVLSAVTAASLLHGASALAQQQTAEVDVVDTVIVTGTRVSDRTVADSQSPIDILTPEVLQSTGTTELAAALSRALPSLNFPRPALVDGTSGVRPAQLRGLSPDQVLILVNGKRRHISALVNVNGSIGRGSSAVDLNAIPVASIERVEVLRDGASAQYGSDAIAGVINIVLKGSGQSGSIVADAGQYSKGDGEQYQLSGDAGLNFGDTGFVHFAGQLTDQSETNRAGAYRGTAPNTGNNPGVGETAFTIGDPQVDALAASVNAGFDLSDNVHAYVTATASDRDIVSYAFYRSIGHNALVPQVYPDGYVPEINQISKDLAVVGGVRGDIGDWKWDVSYDYGQNHLEFYTQHSINYSLGVTSPSRFYDGRLEYAQHVVNADVSRAFDWGLAAPATLSFGTEYRREEWAQKAGDPTSYTSGGAQGFGGFTPGNAGTFDRHSYAAYVGLEADITDRLSAGIAGRYEDYSDFGNETSGKLSARYEFTDAVALRGTVASGFRAPSLAQQNYQVVTTNIIGNVPFETGTFPAAGAVAQALGGEPLQAETSLSYSLGLVLQPIDRLYVTIDAYQIEIDDRIVLSSNLQLANNAAAQALLGQLGITNVQAARYFNNAIDTRTRGVDLVGSYAIPLGAGRLSLTGGYNYNETEVTRVVPNPAVLDALGANLERIGRDERGRIEEGFPRDKIALSGTWTVGPWAVNLGATRYGEFTTRTASASNIDYTYDARWLVDASASWRVNGWAVTLGADNVFDEYPERSPYENSTFGQFLYPTQSPFGFNGTYLYGKLSYQW